MWFDCVTLYDSKTKRKYRYHFHETIIQRALKIAVTDSEVIKQVSPHTFHHSSATHLLENCYDIKAVPELFGHKDVRNTMIYTPIR